MSGHHCSKTGPSLVTWLVDERLEFPEVEVIASDYYYGLAHVNMLFLFIMTNILAY